MREQVGHGEYGDALENLIALGLQNGKGFSREQARQVETLGAAMGMEDSSFLVQLRAMCGQNNEGAQQVSAIPIA